MFSPYSAGKLNSSFFLGYVSTPNFFFIILSLLSKTLAGYKILGCQLELFLHYFLDSLNLDEKPAVSVVVPS